MKLNFFILCHCIASICTAQNWSTPLNISNMDGLDNQPDITIDHDGTFHCVWAHKVEDNYWKIFYSKSVDEGLTWSVSEDVSLNDEKWIAAPHIVCDSENNLHLVYDYDVGNYPETLVYYKKFDGKSWSNPIVLSENMPGSYNNRLTIDMNNRIYAFWYNSGLDGYFYYRYFDNRNWSAVISPYNYHMVVVNPVTDFNSNVHCIAAHNGGQANNNRYVYFIYDSENNLWSDTTEISKVTSLGADMDLDSNNFPHFVWLQKSPMTGPGNDSTMYRFYNGNEWTTPELIVEDPMEQQIVIDENWKQNIFDVEKTEEGSMLVHYFNKIGTWVGNIIDESEWYGMFPVVLNYNHKLLSIYSKPILNTNGEIFFSKSNIITGIDNLTKYEMNVNVYPNPFCQNMVIDFMLNDTEDILIKIYNIEGELVNTLINENKSPGNHEIIWNGRDQGGKEIAPGLYLVRMRAGKCVVTRSVLFTK